MVEWLRDIALGFCPAWVRSRHRPHSPATVLRASTFTGILQSVLCAWGLLAGYRSFVAVRAEQYGQVINRANETTQAWFSGILFIEYILFHPPALLLLYLACEGCVRFVAGLCVSEVVGSLPITVVFAIQTAKRNRQERRESERLASIADAVEVLEGGARIRIASARPKPGWNASLTIEIRREHYELEREERGAPPRVHVYLLRRAPIGKIIRGYERYEVTTATRGS
jgi:hypothetical protein